MIFTFEPLLTVCGSMLSNFSKVKARKMAKMAAGDFLEVMIRTIFANLLLDVQSVAKKISFLGTSVQKLDKSQKLKMAADRRTSS